MKKKIGLVGLCIALSFGSCVSKKKLTQAENKLMQVESRLSKETAEKRTHKEEKEALEATVENYNQKIYALQKDNQNRVEIGKDGSVMSETSKQNMRRVLQKMNPDKVAGAKTLNDSINLAVAYNIQQSLNDSFGADGLELDANGNPIKKEGLEVSVAQPVVKITINNSILFKSGSAWVNKNSHPLIEKLANLIKSEPNMEVLVEGHADATPVVEGSYLGDNWMMASKRAIAVVRLLEGKFDVLGEQLAASSRGEHKPVAENETSEGRAKNRRTTITLMPNMEKFMEMMK
ncbi:OmpA/MotB family protein [Psychroflexus maritimus]|uniref:OmpA family protein n=1 Tax=Psychroflexus maritimus TaxID=2714865 RepID=A0A967E2D5_9FLAO|nr:OmpA family protein [Psychroflexus maritimus]NGZ89659.1 OmpA family protein [Psychroflexus maritimus]